MSENRTFGLDKLTEEQLAKQIEQQAKELKELSKGTIENRWTAGLPITEKQMEYLKSKGLVDPEEVKSFIKTKVLTDKDGNIIGSKKIKMFQNKIQDRIDRAIGENVLTSVGSVMSNNRRLAENDADLQAKQFDLHHLRGNLAGARAVAKQREAAAIAQNMKANNIAYLSRKAIYEDAVKSQKLLATDLKEHVAETTPVVTAPAPTTA